MIIAFAALLCSCSEGGDGNVQAPICEITSPEEGAQISLDTWLTVKGTGSAPGSNIASVNLQLNGETAGYVTEVPFEYTFVPALLLLGTNSLSLTVTNDEGLSAKHEISFFTHEPPGSMINPSSLELGYFTQESEFTVMFEKNWTITVPESPWLKFYSESSGQWEQKSMISGTGTQTIKIRAEANDKFISKHISLTVATADESQKFGITQAASPDIITLLEDPMLRYAAQISMIIYGIDQDEDGKISAWESVQEPEEGAPYGIDAGQWDIKTTKGIEYFPHLRHLDLNRNPELAELDLSKNPNLLSLHVHGCTSLKSLDLSHVPKLIELGCDHALYVTLDLSPFKQQLHTLAILNRTGGTSTIDLSGYTNLSRLYVYDNGLTGLNLSGCVGLWLLSASGNNFAELDLSEVDRDRGNMYTITNCPSLRKVYVWRGFTLDYYSIFSVDDGVEIIEKG